jgi:hypothetical protein
MEPFTSDNGRMANVTEKGNRSGQMDHSMKAHGKITQPMDRGDSSMLMEMRTKAIGLMIELADTVFTTMLTGQYMRVNG